MSTKSIQSNTYIISDNTPQHLLDIGFHRTFDYDEQYVYNFPVLKYKKITTLRGKITVYTDSKEVKIDVFDINNHSIYAPFYNSEYKNREVIMEKINKNILSEFTKLGIKKKTNERKISDEQSSKI